MAVTVWWHTEGRRQPSVIGKDPSGKHIPGGPYAGPQAAVAGAVCGLAWLTRGLWGSLFGLNMIVQAGIILGLTYYSLRLGAKIDYTHVGRAWDALCGVRTGVTGVGSQHPRLIGGSSSSLRVRPVVFGSSSRTVSLSGSSEGPLGGEQRERATGSGLSRGDDGVRGGGAGADAGCSRRVHQPAPFRPSVHARGLDADTDGVAGPRSSSGESAVATLEFAAASAADGAAMDPAPAALQAFLAAAGNLRPVGV